jgi:hypothetical protein
MTSGTGPWTAPDLDDDYDDDLGTPESVGDKLRGLLASSGKTEPYYPRLLRLKNVHPNGWQRAALVEGMVVLGALVALADKATAWAPLILPFAVAAVVKFHDVVAGLLPRRAGADEPDGTGLGA